jgi:serine/threonine-protein kinase
VFLHTDRDGRIVAKILDFGVSKILEEENNTALTVVGTVLGSPLYMSPEQAMGAEGIDGRTDVFAFGSILFEALSGQRAFDGPNFNALIVTIATTEPKRIDDVAPELPDPLRALIRQCLVTNKANRLESFDKIAEQLDAMMPDLARSDLRLAVPNRSGPNSDADATAAIGIPSDRPPALTASHHPTSVHPPPATSIQTSNSGISAPNSGPVLPTKRTMAITGGMLGIAATALIIAAAFGHGDREPHAAAATQATVVSAVSGAAAASRIATPPLPPVNADVPVISVDSLPVATKTAPPKAPLGNGRLAIVSTPGSCSVSVDGIARGTTPIGALELPAGAHRIDCASASGKSKSVNLTITDGASARYKFSLED